MSQIRYACSDTYTGVDVVHDLEVGPANQDDNTLCNAIAKALGEMDTKETGLPIQYTVLHHSPSPLNPRVLSLVLQGEECLVVGIVYRDYLR